MKLLLLAAVTLAAQAPETPTRIITGDGFTVNIYGDAAKVEVKQATDGIGWIVEVRP